MSNEIQVFSNEQFGNVRVIIKDGEPWFVATDVCRVLEHSNVSMALDRLDSDEKSKLNLGLPGGETNVVNEPGLYVLTLGSRKPEAKPFKRWIAHDVIPAIRKTGGYVSNDDLFIETYFSTVDESTKAVLRTTLSTVREQNKRIAEMKPKEDYYNALVDRGTNLSFRNTAKEIGAPEKRFVRFLLGNGYVYRNKNGQLEPYAEHVKNGLFVMKESKSEKTKWSGSQTLITVQGRDKFRKEYRERGDKQC